MAEAARVHGPAGKAAAMELWRQCTHWLIQCRVLPPSHRVTWDGAQVCELAQALRDGVLLCQLLNNLLPHAINLREVNLRPQMSQVSPRRLAGQGLEVAYAAGVSALCLWAGNVEGYVRPSSRPRGVRGDVWVVSLRFWGDPPKVNRIASTGSE